MITLRSPLHTNRTVIAVLLVVSFLIFETLSAEIRYRVKSSDNVNTIVERYYPNSELSRGQLLVGILIKNPRAFRGGNVNFLLRGKRLSLPDERDFQYISPEKASELLSEHARFFRFGIPGDLPIPTLSEMEVESEELTDTTDILIRQKSQTRKIDQLQQESNELKKQLEALLSEKTNRDQRLLDLEKSLNQSLIINNKSTPSGRTAASVEVLVEGKSNTELQQAPNRPRNELAEMPKSNIDRTSKGQQSIELVDINNVKDRKSKKKLIGPSTSILSTLIWLLPLILLGLFFFYLLNKRKRAQQQNDDVVKVNEAGYIEPAAGYIADFQGSDSLDYQEESSLETSVKLDVARAYIEAEDVQSALDILSEIMEEGSDEQRQQAHDLLEMISSH